MIKITKVKFLISVFLSCLIFGCVDPVEPEFAFEEGIIYVDALVSTSPGASFVSVYESRIEFRIYKNIFQEGATVFFRNPETNTLVNLIEDEGAYLPPTDFSAEVGETWELYITLADGREYHSLSERIAAPVAISAISADYVTDLYFSEAENNYIPGHSVKVDFDDPMDDTNFYYWRFRSYEHITDCDICYDGVLRNGVCETGTIARPPYYSYACSSECFRIRYSENVQIFSDEFVNGTSVNKLSVANVPLYTKENILVEIQQFSLSPSAHKYFKALKDILDNNGGFNAPPPAALIGNIFNPNDGEEYVLGRFTAAAAVVETVFIERGNIQESPLEDFIIGNYEEYGISPDPQTTTAPCEETRYRTGTAPQGWIE
ncbi:hypothetical protein GGR42_001446 [Saonia flava]|uniref:DUF4249 domain-containing protein n=1 Tax=Saonia flava TaxID=523696 RepID=A0A846R0U3_9FLAO|nr:DUF4249 domain-containing protein [Saonia flava]NJB70984.1 hypothetical protein [Saonia flava]